MGYYPVSSLDTSHLVLQVMGNDRNRDKLGLARKTDMNCPATALRGCANKPLYLGWFAVPSQNIWWYPWVFLLSNFHIVVSIRMNDFKTPKITFSHEKSTSSVMEKQTGPAKKVHSSIIQNVVLCFLTSTITWWILISSLRIGSRLKGCCERIFWNLW